MLPNRKLTGRTTGFTLIELLTVIAIIGILAAILIPVVGRVRESANSSKCSSNVRMLVQACHIYAEETGTFPPIEEKYPPPSGPQRNWILILTGEGYTDRIEGISEGGETLWICPTAARTRSPAPGNANTYGRNDQTGPWMGTRRPADSPDRAVQATRTAMIMDGNWNGTIYPTWVNATAAFPDFIHPPSNMNDPSAKINVGFVDGHVESRQKGDGTGENDVPVNSSDVFWSGEDQ